MRSSPFGVAALRPMRRLTVIAMLLMWGLAAAGAQAAADDRDGALREAKRIYFEALDRGDVDAVATLLARGFIDIDPNRGLRERSAFLDDLRATRRGPGEDALRRDWSQQRFWVSGERGVVTGRSTWAAAAAPDGAAGGPAARSIWSRQVTQHWQWQQGRWLLHSQLVALRPAAPEIVAFRSGALTLQAMLFRPDGKGPFPAIVYAHGNEPDPADLLETVGPPLAARGYLVFGPHRRGAGLSADQAENLLRRLTVIEREKGAQARADYALEQLQGPQLDDMAAAIAAVRQRPDVDGAPIYVIGNSFGGMLAMLAAERGLGLAGVANFAGAAINWERAESFRELMQRAARNAQVPVFVAQAENDYSIAPTKVLGGVLCEAKKLHRAKVFPRFGITVGEGHSLGVDGFDRWGDEVFGFLRAPSANPQCR